MTTLEIQKRLRELGFDPGDLDGIPGRQPTSAISDFQKSKGLKADGIVGPLTMAALFGNAEARAKAGGSLPWLDLARQKKGMHELKQHAALVAFLTSDGKTVGDPARNPWCGDFVETCLAVTL